MLALMEKEFDDHLNENDIAQIRRVLVNKSASMLASTISNIENVMHHLRAYLQPNCHSVVQETSHLKLEPQTSKDDPQDSKECEKEVSDKSQVEQYFPPEATLIPEKDNYKTSSGKRKMKQDAISCMDKNFKKLLTCEHCGYQTHRSDHLKRHLLVHSKEKPFRCDKCSLSYADKYHLDRHMKSRVHAEGEKLTHTYQCDACDYKTDKRVRMERHKRTHSGEKPFVCQYCDYKAAQQTTLSRHLLTHTGEKPFKCNQCDYSAADTKSLRFHNLQKHSSPDGTMHNCPHCIYATPVYRYFQLHMRTHSDLRPYLCHICGYSAKRPHGLSRHHRSMHELNSMKKSNIVTESLDHSCNTRTSSGPQEDMSYSTTPTCQTSELITTHMDTCLKVKETNAESPSATS